MCPDKITVTHPFDIMRATTKKGKQKMLAQITISISDKDFYGVLGVAIGLLFGVSYTIAWQTYNKANKGNN